MSVPNILQRVRAHELTLGMYVSIADPIVIELAASAGYDFVRIDCEHAMLDMQTVAHMVRAADAAGLATQVRVASVTDIPRLLDIGVQGIVVPSVKTKKDALRAVGLVKYAPLGERGMASVVRALDYGTASLKSYAAEANNTVSLTVQIESREGLSNIEDILSVQGVDFVSSGKQDLSQALGVMGDAKNPMVLEAEDRIIQTAIAYGKFPTLLVNDTKRAEELVRNGVNCLTVCYDVKVISAALRAQVEKFRGM